MKILPFDSYLFTQIGLDSGAITRLGAVVHGFGHPGEYRGTVATADRVENAFVVSVDPASAVAELRIDLAALARGPEPGECCNGAAASPPRYTVHPRGFAVFHVGSGAGGYHVNVRRADENPDLKAYDTRTLQPGDKFAATLLRPGAYSVHNALGHARAELRVAYPVIGKTAYRPPPPITVELGERIEPGRLELHPMQGVIFEVRSPARITVELREPDDGPADRPQAVRPPWRPPRPEQG